MKEVQLNGGPRVTFKGYIGPERELTVETTNWELRLHDGSTPGGIRFLNVTQNDSRYQARSEELDGFEFGANGKGFLTRLSPSTYKLRELTADPNNLGIDNPLGLLGNPLFKLLELIKSNHQFSGDIEFTASETKGVKWVGEVKGDVEGDTAGTHTGDVLGDVTGDLLGDSTGKHTGDLDVRGHTVQMDPGQIQLAWLSSAIMQLFADRGIPYGGIIMWSGTVDDIEDGWALCDGTNGTPNLVGFFIRAAGPSMPAHSSGGSNTHDHAISASGPHGHTISVDGHALTVDQIPSHRHLNGVVDKNDNLFNHGGAAAVPTKGDSIDGNSSNGTREGYTTETGGGQAHSHGVTFDATTGSHTHGREAVSDESNVPQYYALALIMKVV